MDFEDLLVLLVATLKKTGTVVLSPEDFEAAGDLELSVVLPEGSDNVHLDVGIPDTDAVPGTQRTYVDGELHSRSVVI